MLCHVILTYIVLYYAKPTCREPAAGRLVPNEVDGQASGGRGADKAI